MAEGRPERRSPLAHTVRTFRDPFAALTATMLAALADAERGELIRCSGAYHRHEGAEEHRPGTVYALRDRGLLRFRAGPGNACFYRLTAVGRACARRHALSLAARRDDPLREFTPVAREDPAPLPTSPAREPFSHTEREPA